MHHLYHHPSLIKPSIPFCVQQSLKRRKKLLLSSSSISQVPTFWSSFILLIFHVSNPCRTWHDVKTHLRRFQQVGVPCFPSNQLFGSLSSFLLNYFKLCTFLNLGTNGNQNENCSIWVTKRRIGIRQAVKVKILAQLTLPRYGFSDVVWNEMIWLKTLFCLMTKFD